MVQITKEEYMQMYNFVGAAMKVHELLGRCLEEPIYQEALGMELDERGIPYQREVVLHTWYKGKQLKKIYEADFMSNGIMVELKSVSQIHSEHRAQLMNYMRITKTTRGLLINFGEKNLHTERYLFDQESDDIVLLNEQNLHLHIKQTK